MTALMLSGGIMLLVGGFSVMFGPKPPYDQRQQQNASMIETASTVGKVIGALGAILFVVGVVGYMLDRI